MKNPQIQQILSRANQYSHLTVPIATVTILLVLLVPLPSFLLDILISLDLMISVVVLLVSDVHSGAGKIYLVSEYPAFNDAFPAGFKRSDLTPYFNRRKFRRNQHLTSIR